MPVDAIDWLLATVAAAWCCIAFTMLAWWERRTARMEADLDRLITDQMNLARAEVMGG